MKIMSVQLAAIMKKRKNIDWGERESNLVSLLDSFKRSDGGYDVIVPGSWER